MPSVGIRFFFSHKQGAIANIIMKKILFASLLLWGLTGCHSKPAEPAPAPEPAPQVKPEPSAEEQAAEKERAKRDMEQAKKLAKSGQVLPPRDSIAMEIVAHNDKISFDDANRAYEFIKSGIRMCYMRVLAYDLTAKGSSTLDLSVGSGRTVEATVSESDIHAEDFESCLQKASHNWLAPEGAKVTLKLTFTSDPPPTVEEFRQMIDSADPNDHDGHAHGHEGHDHH